MLRSACMAWLSGSGFGALDPWCTAKIMFQTGISGTVLIAAENWVVSQNSPALASLALKIGLSASGKQLLITPVSRKWATYFTHHGPVWSFELTFSLTHSHSLTQEENIAFQSAEHNPSFRPIPPCTCVKMCFLAPERIRTK